MTARKYLDEHTIYGSKRLGVRNYPGVGQSNRVSLDNVEVPNDQILYKREIFAKHYEVSDHLGNVRAVIGDTKWDAGGGIFRPNVITYSNYYPFGMAQPGRNLNSADYKFGYNGKEKDDEIKGSGNSYDYGFRMYDPRVAKFLSIDPLKDHYPWYTPFQFAGNNPIRFIDLDGLEEYDPYSSIISAGYGLVYNFSKTVEETYDYLWDLVGGKNVAVATTGRPYVFAGQKHSTSERMYAGLFVALDFVPVEKLAAPALKVSKKLLGSMKATVITHGADVLFSFTQITTKHDGKFNLVWIKHGDQIDFAFGNDVKKSLRAQFRNILKTPSQYEAHHIISLDLMDHRAVQYAAQGGWHINREENGMNILGLIYGGEHANHPALSDQIREVLNAVEYERFTPEGFAEALTGYSQKIRARLEEFIKNNPGQNINKAKIDDISFE